MRTNAFSKTYNGRTVLTMRPLELESGTVYAVLGANGSGKSTLAKVLAGIEYADHKAAVLRDVNIGYMPQKSYAFRMSVKANVGLGGNDAARAQSLMEILNIDHLAKHRAKKLSGGETARMAMARLLMRNYELLILDEPTASMDMESTALAEELLLRYRKETGCAVLLVTHSLQQARRTADKVIFLHKGELIESGGKELLYTPKEAKTRAFLEFYGV